jgi:TolB-like protein/tetratricopeptide (TPR) repeat protein
MPNIVRFDRYEVDLASGQLYKSGVRVPLRDKSLVLLTALLEHAGEIVTRDDLRRRLWGNDVFVDFDNNLNSVLGRLREALCDSAERPHFIETVPKRGYRFIAEVQPVASSSADVAGRRARLVVLPFVNLSGDAGEEYFADAMTDEIITTLATLAPEQLAVIARTTAMCYKGGRKDVTRIRRELAVDYIVEGAVRRSDGRVGINVQLIQTSDQTHLFARKYDAALRDIFDTQVCIAQGIAASIPSVAKAHAGEAGTNRSKKNPTADLVAYNFYLQGRYQMYKETPAGFMDAKRCFEEAVARDPHFALAFDALGELYWWIGFFGFSPAKEAFSAGLWAALRAIEIDNTLPETHALLGQFRKELDYDWPEVQREMARALELNPASPLVRFRNAISGLMPLGHLEEAVAELETVIEGDPLAPYPRTWLAVILWFARNYRRAIQEIRLVLEMDPDYQPGYLVLGQCRCMEHMFDESITALRKAAELSGDSPMVLGWLGLALAQSGNSQQARGLLDRLHAIAAQVYVPSTSLAWIHFGLGEIDEAFVWMERAVQERDPMMIPIKSYPFLDPIRSDPRFSGLLRKMNLE